MSLRSLSGFAGTFFHEAIHSTTGFADVDRRFEEGITKMIGIAVNNALGSAPAGNPGWPNG